MPEGHTLHALAGRLDRAFAGSPVSATSPQGRFAAGAARLDGTVLRASSAWGKHLFVEFDGDAWLHVHLGLIGTFPVVPLPPELVGMPAARLPVTGQVRLRLAGDGHVADLRGPNLCAVVTPDEVLAVEARLGPDPLRSDAEPERAWSRITASGRPIGELLMDQAVVSGVGNVYRCEVLFRHRVDPFRPGREIRRTTWQKLWDDLVLLMRIGVAYNQILTMEDQVAEAVDEVASGVAAALRPTPTLTGERLGDRFERRFYLYQRAGEPCRVCGSRVRSVAAAGRTLYWCGRCQRRR
jgi:endonuclease-8